MPCLLIRSRLRRRFTFALCFATVLAVAAPVAAASDPKHAQAEAQALHRKADAAYKAERYEDAFTAWEAGYALVPKPLFVVNMAHAQRKLGHLREALALYKRFLVIDPESPHRPEVEGVVHDIEDALAAEDAAARARAPLLMPEPSAPPAEATLAASPRNVGSTRPVYTRWWFWTAAAAVVAGAVATVLVVSTRGSSSGPSQGTLGTLR